MTSKEAHDFASTHFEMGAAERELYKRLLLDGPIQGRYLALDYDEQCCEMSPDQQLARFQKYGTALAAKAAGDAMAAAGLGASDIGGLVVNTCTGYLCPGLSSYVAQELKLDQTTHVMDIMGMGCGGAIPNLQCASGMLAMESHPGAKPVLAVAVEVCSSTMFLGEDPGLIVSNCLFGDGAAAVVLDRTSRANGTGRVRLVDFEAAIFPMHREELRYRHQDGRLRNVLSKRVPVIGARAVHEAVNNLLKRHDLDLSQIDWWIVHPGGETVLDQVAKEMDMPKETLRFSYEILHEYGNMSSPSVLFVLKRLLEKASPTKKQKGIMVSFGAGFTAFATLIEF